jgi:flagellar protein FliO/FliZ
MGFLDQLFGSELPLAVRFLLAFAVVLGLIGLTAWGIRRFSGRRLIDTATGRARQPRLGVLDAFAIDGRRRLVLIRRDNVEHLIMIGGPNDVVIESEIVRAGQRDQAGRNPQMSLPLPPAPAAGQALPQHPGAARAMPQQSAPYTSSVPPRPAAPAPVPPPISGGFGGNRTELRPMPPASMPRPAPPPPQPAPPVQPRSLATPVPPTASQPASPVPPAPAARQRQDIDPLFADIEKKLEEALKQRPQTAAPQRPVAPTPAPPPQALVENEAPPPPPFMLENESHRQAPAYPPATTEQPVQPVEPKPASTVSGFAHMALSGIQQRSAAAAPPPARPQQPPQPEPKPSITAPAPEPTIALPPPAQPQKNLSALDSLEEEMANLLGRGDK